MPPGVAELLNRLDKNCIDDKPWAIRRDAVSALEVLKPEVAGMAAGSLRSIMLHDCNRRVRVAGAHALGELCTPKVFGRIPGEFAAEAVPTLARLLADPDPVVRKIAKDPFNMLREDGRTGDVSANAAPALPELIELLDDEDWRTRQSAARAFADLGSASLPACSKLAESLVDEASQVRDTAKQSFDSLVQNGCCAADLSVAVPPTAELLIAKLKGKSWKIRCSAAWTCSNGSLGSVINVCRLAEILLGDRDLRTRIVAAEMLGSCGLACLPALPELASVLQTAHDVKALRTPCMEALLLVRSEMVNVIGRAIAKNPDLEQAVAHTQFLAKKLKAESGFERDQAIKSLIQPGKSHIASVTELMRVILEPSSIDADRYDEGAAAKLATSFEAFGKFREAGMLGSLDTKGQGGTLIKTLMERACGDRHWRVRLACAEALASQAVQMKRPVDCLQHHIHGEDKALKTSAKRLKRLLEQSGAFLEPGLLAIAATEHLRHVVSKDFDPPNIVDQDLKMARNLALTSLKRMVKAQLIKDDEEFDAFIKAEEVRENREKAEKAAALRALQSAPNGGRPARRKLVVK
eukprot:gb/GFBE01018964.1/.p1 GENE.gb/GFBE01018964.1/~~gb/GFBE01018964.1/.p1  ORF type:complete len:579 (+),score=129.97 gb/GFBE01018964.1/:1-1737(+)